MTSHKWQRVKETFEQGRGMNASEREDFLRTLAVTDPEIVDELRDLLSAYHDPSSVPPTSAVYSAMQIDLRAAGLTLVGSRLGAYAVGPLIGVGGMGEVYQGQRADGEFTQAVAIKVLRSAGAADVARFRTERQILAGLSHPNIARIFDGGATESGAPYFVMEYIHGERIDEYCKNHSLSEGQRLRLCQTVCGAVEYAHARGIIHRDIKPANIMVGDDGSPRLLDFGIAKLADSGGGDVTATMLCTPDYASPEQLRGRALSPASDVYALGAVLFEILTGVRWQTAAGDAKSVRPELARVIRKATADDPAMRYASAAELSRDLDHVLAPKPMWPKIAAAALLAIAIAAIAWRGRSSATERRTIAVIAIENLSQDPSLDWMDRGISELLTTGLAQNESLDVISTERIRGLIGRRIQGDAKLPTGEMRDVAADAHAAAFVSGAVLRMGTRLRLDVKVQDTASGKVLYAHHVEGGDAQAVFRMADETASLVAAKAGAKGGKAATQSALTSNVEALKAYTEGLRFADRFLLPKAIASLRKAIELDPRFAMAHYRIAQFRGPWNPQLCRDETQQALNIAEGMALPRRQKLRMRALYLSCNSQPVESEGLAKSLADENPLEVEAWVDLAYASFSNGDVQTALQACERAFRLDPKSPLVTSTHAWIQSWAGNYAGAMESARLYNSSLEAGDINGIDYFGDIASQFGKLDEALVWYRQEDRADKAGLTLLHLGKYDAAESEIRRDLARLPAGGPARGGRTGFLGDVEIARGRLDRAAKYFEEGVQAYGLQLWFGADVMFKGAQVYLEQGDIRGLLNFAGRLSNPWRAGFRGIGDLLLGKNSEAEIEFSALKTSVTPVLGDIAAGQYAQLYRGVATVYLHKSADAVAALSTLPAPYRMLSALPLARASLDTGDLARAEEELNFVLKSQFAWGGPGWYERQNMLALLLAHYYLGAIAEKRGHSTEAVTHYREFISHFERSNARLPQIAEARSAMRRLSSR